jgi:hypothetical protein
MSARKPRPNRLKVAMMAASISWRIAHASLLLRKGDREAAEAHLKAALAVSDELAAPLFTLGAERLDRANQSAMTRRRRAGRVAISRATFYRNKRKANSPRG